MHPYRPETVAPRSHFSKIFTCFTPHIFLHLSILVHLLET